MRECFRGLTYCLGLLLLALGIILNTKTGLGVAPIMSIPYSISIIWNTNLGNVTLCIYLLFVFGQIILRGKKFRPFDFLQIPMSILFSRVINLFNDMITINFSNLVLNVLLLIAAIILTAIGVALSVEMKLVPNSADGLTQALGERMGKDLGFAKNVLDISCVIIAIAIGLIFSGKTVAVGVGTLATMLGVGRVIALFNKHFGQKISVLVYSGQVYQTDDSIISQKVS